MIDANTIRRLLIAVIVAIATSPAIAGPREQARQLINSLTGVPPSSPQYLSDIAELIKQNKSKEAAQKIIKDNRQFYSVTLKNFFTPWTNRDHTAQAELNDWTATMMGVVRDDLPFRSILTEDILYLATGTITGPNLDRLRLKDGTEVQKYFNANNNHHREIEQKGVDVTNPELFSKQSQMPDLWRTVDPIAGVMSTRQFGETFYQAGTNRRPIYFLVETMLCSSLDKMNDATRADFRVRRDVDRAPGGDSNGYKSSCVGCHAGMDGLMGAFAYYDFHDARTFHVIGEPAATSKVNHNNMYSPGFITTSDHWIQLWHEGPNASFGWPQTTSGNGAKELGDMISKTKAFSQCMAKRVFTHICSHPPERNAELKFVKAAAAAFEDSNTNMKQLFVDTSVACMGE